MINKQSIIDYVMHSPYNANESVLANLLDYLQKDMDRFKKFIDGTIEEITREDLENIDTIPAYRFSNLPNLTKVSIPSTITTIGEKAFGNCYSLNEVYIDDIASWCEVEFEEQESNPLSNGSELYVGDTKITALEIPDGVVNIGARAFNGCCSISSISFADSVNDIGVNAFAYCQHLESLVIPNTIHWLADGAFSYCISLITAQLGTGISAINEALFRSCLQLTSITIPSTVVTIGSYAFYACNKLTDITFQGTKAQWDSITKGSLWDGNTGNYTIHCTDGDIAKS